MKYTLESIIERSSDSARFVAECEREYEEKVAACADMIAARADAAPLILLAGPSGSGKTTTAVKLCEALRGMGRPCQVVSMDDYFRTVNPATHPRNERGQIDFESPHCVDIPLFLKHLEKLHNGKTVKVPHFDFPNQRRHADMFTELSIGKGGLCVFEGIHALNPMFSEGLSEWTQKVYVSARSNIKAGNDLLFKGTWVRLIRRMTRDGNFRGWVPSLTMSMWDSVRVGEKKYISPYKDLAKYQIDTHMPMEMCVFRDEALEMLADIPRGCDRERELKSIRPALEKFPSIPRGLLSGDSLLREFLG